MEPSTNTVESLWNFVISIIWKLWICFAVIVFAHVKFGIGSLSNATPEGNNTKSCRSASVRRIIKTAKRLMRLNKLDDANEILNQGTVLLEDESENSGSELSERRFWAGRLHEIRSLCLYRKGDVLDSMVEMDRGLAVIQNPDSHLLSSANHCFQLFYKWSCENFDQFQQDIVVYLRDKKRGLETDAVQKIANTSLLLESVHCLILSEFLVKCAVLEPKESSDLKKLCQHFFSLLKSGKGDDHQILNSIGCAANEVKYKDLVKETEEGSILKGVEKASEISELVQQSEKSADQETEERLHELENMVKDSKQLETVGEAHATNLAETKKIEELQHVDTEAETLELILDSCDSDSYKLLEYYDNPGNPDVVRESNETRNVHVIQQVDKAIKVPSETSNDFMVCKRETMAYVSNIRSNDTNSVTLNAMVKNVRGVETGKFEGEVECGESQDAETELSNSEGGAKTGKLVDGEVEAGTSEEGEMEHGRSEDDELGKSEAEMEYGETELSNSEDGVETGTLPDGEVEDGTSEVVEMECGKCGSEDDELGKSDDEVECSELQDAKTELGKSEYGVKTGTLADDEVEAGVSEDSEMEHESEEDELEPALSKNSEQYVEPAANPVTVESIDLTTVSNSGELEEQMAENKPSEPCQTKPSE